MLDPLQRIEQQLLVAGRRDVRHRAARRRVTLPVAAVAGLLIVATGASAVSGVGPIARMIDDGPGPPHTDEQARITAPNTSGDRHDALVYRRSDGGYCIQVPFISDRGLSAGACSSPTAVSTLLASGEALVTIAATDTTADADQLVAGIVPADTTAVTVTAPGDSAPADATISDVWTTPKDASDRSTAAKAFLVVLPPGSETSRSRVTVTTPSGSHVTALPQAVGGAAGP